MSEAARRPVAVVTGASRGIGYHAAKGFAAAGAHVIAVARTVGGLEELDDEIKAAGGAATLVPLDLKDFDGIDRLGARDLRALGQARHALRQCRHARPALAARPCPAKGLGRGDGGQRHRELAAHPLARSAAAAERCRAARSSCPPAPRRSCRPFWGPYSVSKAALEALARTYAGEVRNTPIRVVVVDPGRTRTAMRAQAMPGEDPATLPHPSEIVPHLVEMASPGFDRTDVLFDFPAAPIPICRQRAERDHRTLVLPLPSLNGFSSLRTISRIGTPARPKSSRRPLTR